MLKPSPEHNEVVNEALPKETKIPSEWQDEAAPGTKPVVDDWLQSLKDPQLEPIVAEAIANNLDLRQAAETVRIAQQSIVVVTAQQAQAVANYGSVILKAFGEVENALSNEQSLARRLPFNESAVRDRKEAVRIANEQYMAGRKDLLWVTYLEDNLIVTEAELIKLHGTVHRNRIALLLALGGSFDDTPAATISQVADWP